MKTEFLGILLAVAWIVISFYLKGRKQRQNQSTPVPEEAWPVPFPAESVDNGDLDDIFENFAKKKPQYQEAENLEGQSLEKDFSSSNGSVFSNIEITAKEDIEGEKVFDLRQAIIYQTILERKYI